MFSFIKLAICEETTTNRSELFLSHPWIACSEEWRCSLKLDSGENHLLETIPTQSTHVEILLSTLFVNVCTPPYFRTKAYGVATFSMLL